MLRQPDNSRYDAQQSAADRHAFENLLLLCGRHHDVIDADEKAYTVERLLKMKADHEGRAGPIPDDLAEQAAEILTDQSVFSVNQSGGITAYTINAGTINVHRADKAVEPTKTWQLGPVKGHASSFIEDGRILCRPQVVIGKALDIIWYNRAQFFIRIIPNSPPRRPWNFTEIKALVDAGRLMPLPNHPHYFSAVNEFGAVVLNHKNIVEQNSAE